MSLQLKDLARPGDILFYRVTPTSSFIARFIAALELLRAEGRGVVQYSHVAILDFNTDFCIESLWPCVQRTQVDWSDSRLELWRVSASAPDTAVAIISAKGHIGDMYDIWGLLFGALTAKHRVICTTLIQKAFANAGIKIGVSAGNVPTPNELAEDPALQFLGQVSDDLR